MNSSQVNDRPLRGSPVSPLGRQATASRCCVASAAMLARWPFSPTESQRLGVLCAPFS